MKKTSLTRALFVAGVMAMAGSMAQADAIFYPDGTRVELGENGVENGMADRVLAESRWTAPSATTLASLGVSADQSSTVLASSDDFSVDTTTLGAGPAVVRTETIVSTSPVYVFPNIHWDRATVLSQPHPMMSRLQGLPDPMERSAAATFDSPTRAGEASTMTGGAPNMLTDNEHVATVPPSVIVDTTTLGAGPGSGRSLDVNDCGTPHGCSYLPD